MFWRWYRFCTRQIHRQFSGRCQHETFYEIPRISHNTRMFWISHMVGVPQDVRCIFKPGNIIFEDIVFWQLTQFPLEISSLLSPGPNCHIKHTSGVACPDKHIYQIWSKADDNWKSFKDGQRYTMIWSCFSNGRIYKKLNWHSLYFVICK